MGEGIIRGAREVNGIPIVLVSKGVRVIGKETNLGVPRVANHDDERKTRRSYVVGKMNEENVFSYIVFAVLLDI